mgnify:CR=1 FL=1
MSVLICGSLAYDTIMVFPERFKDHILPEKVHILNVSFLVPEMRRQFGGVAGERQVKLSTLHLQDLSAARVRRFLSFLEQERHNHVHSRNQRLAALKTFFDFLATQSPEHFAEAEAVVAIPVKRSPPPSTVFLERDEVQALFASLPTVGSQALRDHALLLFLYNTGARAQEAADLRQDHLELPRRRVRLHGKGDKWRVCPLWEETAGILERL